ncbi:MAG: serine/threonine-protein kinase [Phycisphaerales bacterium]
MTEPDTPSTSLVDILGEAQDLPQHEREEFVRSRCTQPAMLAEALSLLHAMNSAKGFMDQPTMGFRHAPPPPEHERPGTVIGPYRLTDLLGEGGFGVVFAAEQSEPIQRRVAIKIIKPGMDSRAVIARFEQERQALALMDHPGIARVFDAGTTAAGRPYFVMECIQGSPITDFCDRERLPLRERLSLFIQVCDAVQHAHTKGVIHRDLKPANILVAQRVAGAPPRPVIIDFGVAKAVSLRSGGGTLMTEQGLMLGTPEYMSPEQADLSESQVDTRTDIYALGVVLYELLTGVLPFDPRELRAAGYAAIQRILRESEPPRPSTRLTSLGAEGTRVAQARRVQVGELASDLRAELEWIPLRAMRKARDERYRSAAELADDIANYLQHKPLLAGPESAAYRVRKFVRRNRAVVGAGSVVVCALLLGAGGTAFGLVRARQERAEAVTQADLARANAALATQEAARADRQAQDAKKSEEAALAVNDLMTSTIRRANRVREQGRDSVTVREVMDRAAADLRATPGARPPRVEGALARAIAENYRELGLYAQSLDIYLVALDRTGADAGADSVAAAEVLGEVGQLQHKLGRPADAAESLRSAQRILTSAGQPGEEALAVLGLSLASLASDEGDDAAAKEYLRRTEEYFASHGKTDSTPYCTTLLNQAVVAMREQKPEVARPLLEKLSAILDRAFPDDPMRIQALHGLATVQRATRDPAAIATMERTLAAARIIYGDEHPEVGTFWRSLATLKREAGDTAGALDAAEHGYAIAGKVLDARSPERAAAAETVASLYLDVDRAADAEPLLRDAVGTLMNTDAKDKPWGVQTSDILISHYEWALALRRTGRGAEARSMLEAFLPRAAEQVKAGDRYEWVMLISTTVLGELLADSAAASPAEQRDAGFAGAEVVLRPAAERLIELAPKIGPKSRQRHIPAVIDRVLRLYRQWDGQGSQHATQLEFWRKKAEEAGPAVPPLPR